MTEIPVRISLVWSHAGPDGSTVASRAVATLDGKNYGCDGPCPLYRLSTLVYLDGHRGQPFEVHDDRSPTSGSGGLAMTGKARNWAVWNGLGWVFRRDAKREPDFTADQVRDIATAARRVVDLDQKAPPCFANARQCA